MKEEQIYISSKQSYIDVQSVTEDLVLWIQDWFDKNGKDCKAVIGISGGKDSSVVAALCVKALGKDRVFGVLMPNGNQTDIVDSRTLCNHLGIEYIVVNIKDAVTGVLNNIEEGLKRNRGIAMISGATDYLDFDISEQTKINLPARIRMATLYAISQSVNGRVANTCNLSETMISWETRWGDAVGDFSPLANLTVKEVIEIGEFLGLPISLTRKVPSDGLCGKTDEESFGFTYKELDQYIRMGQISDLEHKKIIDERVKKYRFKREQIPCFENNLNNYLKNIND